MRRIVSRGFLSSKELSWVSHRLAGAINAGVKLFLGDNRIIKDPTEKDIHNGMLLEEFIILEVGPLTFIQCAEDRTVPFDRNRDASYVLEYQSGSLAEHYEAAEGALELERVFDVVL